MTRILVLAITIVFVMGSCSSLKPLSVVDKPQASQGSHSKDKGVKFLDISVSPQASVTEVNSDKKNKPAIEKNKTDSGPSSDFLSDPNPGIENANSLQLRYSIILNTEVEQVRNLKMFEYLDQWYGTRYCMGGTTKNCIDCSAFVQAIFTTMYGIALPRTAREQYKKANKISRTEMQEGDLLFFNTTGGVSHVGVYLQNNKFVHASASEGVTISDVFDSYWVKRFIGVGRIEVEN